MASIAIIGDSDVIRANFNRIYSQYQLKQFSLENKKNVNDFPDPFAPANNSAKNKEGPMLGMCNVLNSQYYQHRFQQQSLAISAEVIESLFMIKIEPNCTKHKKPKSSNHKDYVSLTYAFQYVPEIKFKR
ncbi:hypothetical protein ABEB36_008710 [Hypothenemus hampei]|uniref:Uncharacterized protein n=1 Tax=Hypothenemus hampei TaxID=57062 RepID=A0ABD1EMT7_HYPHA